MHTQWSEEQIGKLCLIFYTNALKIQRKKIATRILFTVGYVHIDKINATVVPVLLFLNTHKQGMHALLFRTISAMV